MFALTTISVVSYSLSRGGFARGGRTICVGGADTTGAILVNICHSVIISKVCNFRLSLFFALPSSITSIRNSNLNG